MGEEVREQDWDAVLARLVQADAVEVDDERWTIACIQQMYS